MWRKQKKYFPFFSFFPQRSFSEIFLEFEKKTQNLKRGKKSNCVQRKEERKKREKTSWKKKKREIVFLK